jgi:formylglycine-generating enzyme required for sulfatase activity
MSRYCYTTLGPALLLVLSCACTRRIEPSVARSIPDKLVDLCNSAQREEWYPAVEELGRLASSGDRLRAVVWSRAKVNSVGMKFAWIKPGTFMMGPGFALDGSDLAHPVEITRGFFISVTEVTNAQYAGVIPGYTPYARTSPLPDMPAVHVTWEEASQFCETLSQLEGARYRLPTEAEWEYACRGGSTGYYCFPEDPSLLDDWNWKGTAYWPSALEEYAWCNRPYSPAARVASFKPNAYGLYDMHGNALEWVSDWYLPYREHPGVAAGAVARDPRGPASGSTHVLRGGPWLAWVPRAFTSTCRGGTSFLDRPLYFEIFDRKLVGVREATGFRVVRESD